MSALENNDVQGSSLSDLEVRILDFESNWWRFAGAKESAIKELFDLTAPNSQSHALVLRQGIRPSRFGVSTLGV